MSLTTSSGGIVAPDQVEYDALSLPASAGRQTLPASAGR